MRDTKTSIKELPVRIAIAQLPITGDAHKDRDEVRRAMRQAAQGGTLQDQFIWHAEIAPPTKSSWNLDSWRADPGALATGICWQTP